MRVVGFSSSFVLCIGLACHLGADDNSSSVTVPSRLFTPNDTSGGKPNRSTQDEGDDHDPADENGPAHSVTRRVDRETDVSGTDTSQPETTHRPDTAASRNVQSLDKMVISATRTRRRIRETPASVSLISRDVIETSAAKDINDLVANETGVQVRRSVGMGEGVPSDISLRGIPGALAATRTLILVDGIPTNASGTPFMILNEIPIDIIENIEIVRGPFSSLYGANAFGGVINVMTKRGDGKPGVAGLFETSYPFNVAKIWSDGYPVREAAGMGAETALWNGDVMSSGGNGKIHYLVNGGYRTIGNYMVNDSVLVEVRDTSYLIPANLHGEEKYGYSDLRLFGKMGYRFNEKLSFDLHTRYFRSDLGFGYTRYSAPDTIDITVGGEKIIIGPQLEYRFSEKTVLRATGYYRKVEGAYITEMDKRPVEWKSNARDWQVDLQGVFTLSPAHIVTAGSEFLSNRIMFGDLVDNIDRTVIEDGVTDRITNSGAYIQDEWKITERLLAVPGVRFDYHTVFGIAFSPKLGVSATLNEKVHIRSSVGRAFRAPNHTELFMQPLPLKDTITLVSNPELTPEYVWSADGGVDLLPLPNLRLQCGLFYNRMHDLIGQGIKIESQRAYVTHDNISSAWSAGSELEAEWRPLHDLKLHGGYVFQKSRNEHASTMAKLFKRVHGERAGVATTDIQLDYMPSHKASIGLSWGKRIGKARLAVSGNELFVGKRTYLNFNQLQFGKESERIELWYDLRDNRLKVNPKLMELKPYARFDIMVRFDLAGFWAIFAVQNCFNALYEENFGTFAPGRLATVKIGASL